MANDMLDNAEKLNDTAELLRRSADRMHDRRRDAFMAAEMTVEQFQDNAAAEALLREHITDIFVAAIGSAVVGAETSQQDLERAINKANKQINEIQDLRRALGVFAALITLAGSIASLQPVAILGSLKAVKDATSTGA